MRKEFHRLITAQALRGSFSESALDAIIQGNLFQDRPRGQVGHPEFHFDDNAFLKTYRYIESNRSQVVSFLQQGSPLQAWFAFGRLTHAAQDFYSHSNYVALWLERFAGKDWSPADAIDPLDAGILAGPLRSGRIYWPLEPLSFIPALTRYIVPLLPRDSHAWMNLDYPERGPLFAYAFSAAVKRTQVELQQTMLLLSPSLADRFRG